MKFFATVSEQAVLLSDAHKQRPMKAVAQVFDDPKGRFTSLDLTEDTVLRLLRDPGVGHGGVWVFLREASLSGDFVFRPHPRYGTDIDMVPSLCAQFCTSVTAGGEMLSGFTALPNKGWYGDLGLDIAPARRVHQFLAGRIRRAWPHRGAPEEDVRALETGKAVRVIAALVACISDGAVKFREEGGHLRDQQGLEYALMATTTTGSAHPRD